MPKQQLTLSALKPGDWCKISGFEKGDKCYRQKLLAMGLTPNTKFQVIRRAPLGDPIQIKVRNYSLGLRQAEASLLKVERVG